MNPECGHFPLEFKLEINVIFCEKPGIFIFSCRGVWIFASLIRFHKLNNNQTFSHLGLSWSYKYQIQKGFFARVAFVGSCDV